MNLVIQAARVPRVACPPVLLTLLGKPAVAPVASEGRGGGER
jgi:hypothetical protein